MSDSLGWSLQDGACVVRAGHGRGITRMPLGLNARQRPGFLSGIEAFGNTRAHAHANMRSSHQSPLWNGNRLLRTVCSQVLEVSGGAASDRIEKPARRGAERGA